MPSVTSRPYCSAQSAAVGSVRGWGSMTTGVPVMVTLRLCLWTATYLVPLTVALP